MARDIDLSEGLESLSQEDLEYLRDRGRLTPEQEREYFGGVYPNPPEDRSVEETPNTGDVDVNATNPAKRDGTPDSQAEELPDNYEDWTKAQLIAEAAARGIPTAGSKHDLISRLAAHDAATAEGSE